MNDDRPRPQFGAYASPEEQRARSGQDAPKHVSDPALVPRDMTPEETVAPRRPGQRDQVSQGALIDRIITVALMAFGLYSILGGIRVYTDPYSLVAAIGMSGIELSDPGALRVAGIVSIVVMLIGWAGTVWILWRRNSRRKTMWWIALIAGVAFTIVGALIVAVPFAMDPAVLEKFAELQGIELP
jgi:hypothetical protein